LGLVRILDTVGRAAPLRFRFTYRKTFASKNGKQITYRRNPMAEAVENKCAHPKCTCTVADGKEYCSQACSEAAESGSLSNNCGCDHPGCIGAIAA
jgi:hypothetical protein